MTVARHGNLCDQWKKKVVKKRDREREAKKKHAQIPKAPNEKKKTNCPWTFE